jgi:hypothetical protein
VNRTVGFDNEPDLQRGKVSHETRDRVLPPKLHAEPAPT